MIAVDLAHETETRCRRRMIEYQQIVLALTRTQPTPDILHEPHVRHRWTRVDDAANLGPIDPNPDNINVANDLDLAPQHRISDRRALVLRRLAIEIPRPNASIAKLLRHLICVCTRTAERHRWPTTRKLLPTRDDIR